MKPSRILVILLILVIIRVLRIIPPVGFTMHLQQLLNALASQSKHEDTNSIVKRDAKGNLYEDFTHPKAIAKVQADAGIKHGSDFRDRLGMCKILIQIALRISFHDAICILMFALAR
jgi:hypothetical protein